MYDIQFLFEGHKSWTTSSLSFDQLYTSGGVDCAGILGHEGLQNSKTLKTTFNNHRRKPFVTQHIFQCNRCTNKSNFMHEGV
jgi:hypothetical protein